MKFSLTNVQKLFLSSFCFFIAMIGFMLKLPSFFRHFDKELHAAFYFFAAFFLNLLFPKRHFLIFGFLFFFGTFIELFQQFSNRFFEKRIHGNFDPEDIQSNLIGLVLFSIIWFLYKLRFSNQKIKN